MPNFRRQWRILRTRLLWQWRLNSLGSRSVLGTCRRVVHPAAMSIGRHVTIFDGWILADLKPGEGKGAKIRIGDWCIIHPDFQCNAAVSVEMGEHVLVAGRVFVTDSDHVVDPLGPHTTQHPALVSSPVIVEHDCWIGQNAVILKGVHIGHHSIVGANSVVTKDVPPCSIVAGIPAKLIGSTFRS